MKKKQTWQKKCKGKNNMPHDCLPEEKKRVLTTTDDMDLGFRLPPRTHVPAVDRELAFFQQIKGVVMIVVSMLRAHIDVSETALQAETEAVRLQELAYVAASQGMTQDTCTLWTEATRLWGVAYEARQCQAGRLLEVKQEQYRAAVDIVLAALSVTPSNDPLVGIARELMLPWKASGQTENGAPLWSFAQAIQCAAELERTTYHRLAREKELHDMLQRLDSTLKWAEESLAN